MANNEKDVSSAILHDLAAPAPVEQLLLARVRTEAGTESPKCRPLVEIVEVDRFNPKWFHVCLSSALS
jgi:hypothetical protein